MQIAAKAPDDSALYERLPQVLRTKLMPFQRLGVQFALANGGRVLVGDEMGATLNLANPRHIIYS